jgi:hypothetical protein
MSFPGVFGSPARSAKSSRSSLSYLEDEQVEMIRSDQLRMRIEESGAIPLSEAEIFILSDWVPGPMTKERVYFVSNGDLEKLIVNVLLVIYVP